MSNDLALEIRKILLIENRMSETQAAKLIDMTQANFNKKLNSGTLRYNEVAALLDALGYDIIWKKR